MWSPELGYPVGLAATDGCLISGKTMLGFTSKDRDLVQVFLRCIGRPGVRCSRLVKTEGVTFRAQFGDAPRYRWLQSIGLTPRKGLTIGALDVPEEHVAPFARGVLDGEASVDCYVRNPIRRIDPEYRYMRLGVRFPPEARSSSFGWRSVGATATSDRSLGLHPR